MGAPSVDVVIPCHNGWALTRACLLALREQSVPHQVIVADDASQDETPRRIRAEFPEVRLVELARNVGSPGAVNAGVRAGSGELIVLLNNDTEPGPGFLEAILAPLQEDRAAGSATPVMVRPDGRVDNVGMSVDRTVAGFARLAGRQVADAGDPSMRLVGPSGGAAAYRREAWESVEGLDEHIFIYSDDLDLAVRLRAAGWGAALAPEAFCLHHGSQTMGRRSARQRRHHGFARGYLLRRYGVLRTAAAARALVTEALVCAGDLVFSRDLVALRSRLRGWRAARGLPRRELPPEVVADEIDLMASLRLRRADYDLAGDAEAPRFTRPRRSESSSRVGTSSGSTRSPVARR